MPTNSHDTTQPIPELLRNCLSSTDGDSTQSPHGNTRAVTECLNRAVEYFTANLTPSLQAAVSSQWGFAAETIEQRDVGYTTPPDAPHRSLVSVLENNGFSRWTILQTGLVVCPPFRHILECAGTTDPSCYHDVPASIDRLSRFVNSSSDSPSPSVSPDEIDYQALYKVVERASDGPVPLQFWWDNRLIFPYPDATGTYRYLIARATADTEDCVRDSGISDRTSQEAQEAQEVTIRFGPTESGTVCFQPPAVAVNPGDTVRFSTPFDTPIPLHVEYSTADAWKSGPIQSLPPQPCPAGGTYQFEALAGGRTVRGAVLATDSFSRTQRIGPIADWLADTTQHSPQQAKYLKQAKSKPWVDSEAIYEPLYGLPTIESNSRLLITEGVTDAIAAHESGIPCLSPVTTQFKSAHHSALVDAATAASEVVVMMDNDTNNAGIDGALRLSRLLVAEGIPATVAELPRPSETDSIDVAEFLKHHSVAEFCTHLDSAVRPEDHPHYDPEVHAPSSPPTAPSSPSQSHPPTTQTVAPASSTTAPTSQSADSSAQSTDSERISPENMGSAIFDLTLSDVAQHQLCESSSPSSVICRTTNPFFTQSPPQSFVVLRPSLAYEHWQSVDDSYTPLAYLACDAGVRDPRSPSGSFSAEELWQVWKFANETPYVTHPSQSDAHDEDPSQGSSWNTDPVPRRAMWHLANKHSLCDGSQPHPSKQSETPRLPRSLYNQVLELIMSTYDLNPGRDIQL